MTIHRRVISPLDDLQGILYVVWSYRRLQGGEDGVTLGVDKTEKERQSAKTTEFCRRLSLQMASERK